MNEENKEVWEAEIIIDPNTKKIVGYTIKGLTYVFANHIDNICTERCNKPKLLIGCTETINLIYVSDEGVKEKFLVGFFIGNVIYLDEIYDSSVIDNTQIYTMKEQLMTTGFSYAKPNDEIALNFNKVITDIPPSFVREKKQKPLVYNKQKTYNLHLVLNKIATGVIKCIIDGKTFLFVRSIGGKNKKNILDLSVGSSIQMRAIVHENNILGFVICDDIFIKASHCAQGKYAKLISQNIDCDIQAHVEIIKNNIKPIVLVSEEEQATATFSETNLAYEFNAETTSLADSYDTDSETNLVAAKNDFQTKTKRSTHGYAAIPIAKTKRSTYDTKDHITTETTRLTDSSVENLQKLNSRHCNIL